MIARTIAMLLAAAGAVPAAAAGGACPVPAHWGTYARPSDIPPHSLVNTIRLQRKGKVFWNGRPSDSEQVKALIDLAKKMKGPHNVIVLDRGDENCETFAFYARIIDRLECTRETCLVGKGPPSAGRAPAPDPD